MSSLPASEEIDLLRSRLSALEAELRLADSQREACWGGFLALADAAPVPVWMSGADSVTNYFNRAWLDFRGRFLEEETADGWSDGLHPDDRERYRETYAKAFAARQPFRVQLRLRSADGTYRWVEHSGAPRFDHSGMFAGYLGFTLERPARGGPPVTPDEETVQLVLSLTKREREVLVLIAEGNSTKQAAARLRVSYKTVDSHRTHILEKLHLHETASLVRFAVRAGLIQP